MKKIRAFFASQNFQKFTALGIFLIILAAIPLTLSQVSKPQVISQHAAWQVPQEQHYACGPITIYLDIYNENPSCPSGTVSGGSLTSFTSSVIMSTKNSGTGAYTVHYQWDSFWCPTEDPHKPCLSNRVTTNEQRTGITGQGAGSTTIPLVSKSAGTGQACGYYQNDFGFFITANNSSQVLCGISLNTLGNTNNNASWCHTGVSCTTPTDTPTPTTPVTITPTDTPTPVVTDTPTPPVTDTPTPGLTITPTNTPGPSDTPTPTGAPSDTPTPVIATTTPKPTLPPTGPGNTVVAVGFLGVAIAVAGFLVAVGM